jgi:GNAT superfamily N-acetyltransferase
MINWLEWLGYLASVLIAVSLLMSSLIKLRWVNLVGSTVFAVYGLLINAIPVVVSNTIIIFINIYYLYKIYTEKEYFKLIEMDGSNEYLRTFFEFYKSDIKKFFPDFKFVVEGTSVSFYILRNMVAAGVFIATEHDKESLFIDLDFVMPEYRDFKIGAFIFDDNEKYFRDRGYKRLVSYPSDKEHNTYLRKMGFREVEQDGQKLLVRNVGRNR